MEKKLNGFERLVEGLGCASCSRKNGNKENKVEELNLENINNTINVKKTIIDINEERQYYRIEEDTIVVDFPEDHNSLQT